MIAQAREFLVHDHFAKWIRCHRFVRQGKAKEQYRELAVCTKNQGLT